MTSQIPTLDGPRLQPASGGKAKKLVVFLHGYGADGNDLIDLGRHWASLLPEVAFVSPHASEPCYGAPMGRQWFRIPETMNPAALWEGSQSARPVLNAFLDAELERLGLTDPDLALVGFSQGAMMALDLAPRRAGLLAGVVGYSGLVTGGERLAAEARQAPPVLLVHGDQDTVIPPGAMAYTAGILGGAGLAVEWHLRPGLGHGIDQEGLRLGGEFLRRVLG